MTNYKIDNKEKKILKEFKKRLRGIYKENLEKIILFGSRARGDYSRESDYDFLISYTCQCNILSMDIY